MKTISTCVLLIVLGINTISANIRNSQGNSKPRNEKAIALKNTNNESKSIRPNKTIKAKHIQQLNTITNNSAKPYREKIQLLKQSVNQGINIGFEFREKPNGDLPYVTELYATDSGVRFDDVQIDSQIRMINRNHKFDPIFSAEDIYTMADFFVTKNDLGAKDDDEITTILISKIGAYALVVEDSEMLFSFQNDIRTGMVVENNKYKNIIDIYKKSYQEEVIRKAQQKCNNSCSDNEYDKLLEENFIEWFNSWETGLGIYKGIENEDGTYRWEKMEGSYIKLGLAIQN